MTVNLQTCYRNSLMKWLIIPLGITLSTPTLAEVQCKPDNPKHCVQPISKGQLSLLDGQVLSTELAIHLGQKAEKHDILLEEAVNKEKELGQIRLNNEKQLSAIELEAEAQRTAYWQQRALEAEKGPPFYQKPIFVIPVTVVTVLAVVKLSVEVLKANP